MIFNIIKILHIVSVISWMAGLLYLPRIFVYHSDSNITKETSLIFIKMESRLYKYICHTAAVITWLTGISLVIYIGLEIWLILKILLVIFMTFFHFLCGRWLKAFSLNQNQHSVKFYRIVNEFPTLLIVLIVILVIIKPFE
tara:strand:- start:2153 stop:2575 length:423 start_codon:yes stop_codon:yes gene_type:complete